MTILVDGKLLLDVMTEGPEWSAEPLARCAGKPVIEPTSPAELETPARGPGSGRRASHGAAAVGSPDDHAALGIHVAIMGIRATDLFSDRHRPALDGILIEKRDETERCVE